MADNTKTLKMWQEAAAETKDCLPLETLERMMDNNSRRCESRGAPGWLRALPDRTGHAEEL